MPIADSEMLVIMDEEIAALDDLVRPTWKKVKTKIAAMTGEREDGSSSDFYVVGRSDDEVIAYDAEKKTFGTGIVEEGTVRRWSVYGPALRDALRHFPRHRRA